MGIGLEVSRCLAFGVSLVAVACGGGSSNTNSAADNFWPSAYDPTGAPSTNESAYHIASPTTGQSCLACHNVPGNAATTNLVFGGTVYRADGTTPAGNVQVGVVDGTKKYFVYSAANGQYWAEGTDTLTWSTADDIRIRDANGEKATKTTDGRGADCDSCHGVTGAVLTAP